MKPLDYSLYNKVKEKFSPLPFTIIFVSLAPENLEKLEGVAFKREEIVAFRALIRKHSDKLIPYATIGGFTENEVSFYFACPEFEQEENLVTGNMLESSIGTYHNNPIDIEAVKRDLQKLNSGIILSGNA